MSIATHKLSQREVRLVGTMTRFFIGFVIVVFLIAAWVLAIGIGQALGQGLSEILR